jgi:hypothetical protein
MASPLNDPSALGAMVSKALAGGGADDLIGAWQRTRDAIRDAARKDPVDTAFATVFCGAYLFYLAERGKNPKVKTFGDALLFISTNMSVGYSDIFARTEAGKYIASAVMTVGPAMVAQLLAPTAAEQRADTDRAEARHAELMTAIQTLVRAIERR